MRSALTLFLILTSRIASAGPISIDCEGMHVSGVIADIASQSGQQITLAVPTDAKVTARLTNVGVDEALEVISSLCQGTFTRTDSGYRVYPQASPEHVLGLVRGMYSKVEDYEVTIERKAEANSVGIKTLTSRSVWKSTGVSRSEYERISRGRVARDLTVEDGQWRWLSRSDDCCVERLKPQIPRTLGLVTSTTQWALPFLASLQPADLPNLTCTKAEQRNGRPVYIMEYDHLPSTESYKAPESGQWAPPPGQPPMYPSSGTLRVTGRGLEMEYSFARPSPTLAPTASRKMRFGVDAETGMVALVTAVTPYGTHEVEALDVREVVPGVFIPFATKRLENEAKSVESGSPVVEIRINAGIDGSQFTYAPPDDRFVVDYPISLEACETALKKNPDDPDLLFTRARCTTSGNAEQRTAVLRDYEHAVAARPKTRAYLLTTMLGLACDPSAPDAAVKYIAEIRQTMPDDRDAAFAVARAYRDIGKDFEALEEFGKLCASSEKRSEAPLNETAALCLKTGDKARAERLYLEVLAIGDANQCEQAAQSLQEMYAAGKRLGALRGPLEAASKRLPDASGLLVRYGLLLSKLGEPDAAMGVFRRVAEGKSAGAVSQAVRELKAAQNFKGAIEIGETFMSQSRDRQDRGGNSGIINELSGAYIAVGITIPEAIEVYRKFAVSARDQWLTSSALRMLRSLFAQMKVLPEAAQVAHRMWKADKSDMDIAGLLIELAAPMYRGDATVDPTVSATVLKDLMAERPEEPALYAMLGEVLAGQGNYPDAAKAFRRGMELSPNQPYYYAALADVYSRVGEHDRALDLLRRLLARAPSNEYFYAALGVGHANAGQWEGAVTQFLKADELRQTRPKGVDYSQILDALIRCYEKLGDAAAVERVLVQKVDRALGDWQRPAAVKALANFYAKNGEIGKCISNIVQIEDMKLGQNMEYVLSDLRSSVPKEKLKELADELAAALAEKPDLFYTQLLLAEWHADLQDFTSALRIYNDLATRSWDDPKRLVRIHQSLSNNPNYARFSMQVCERLVVLEPNKLWHSVSLVGSYRTLGLTDKCTVLVQELMRYVRGGIPLPEDSSIQIHELAHSTARAFTDLKMLREAVEAYQFAIDLGPERAEGYRWSLAQVYVQAGDPDAALAEYASLMRTAKNEWRREGAIRESARLYERQRNVEEAVKHWKMLLSTTSQEYVKTDAQRQIDRLTAPPPEQHNPSGDVQP